MMSAMHCFPEGTVCQIWSVSSGELAWGLHQKSITGDKWPAIKWDSDETAVFHMVTNNVHVYKSANGFKGAILCMSRSPVYD